MRLLRKKGTLEPTWPFHPILAARSDMEEVRAPEQAEAAAEGEGGEPVAPDRDTLKAKLKTLGVTVRGKPSLDKLQAMLAEAEAAAEGEGGEREGE